jgi:hypothetical protein
MGTSDSEPAWLSFMRYVGGLTYADENPEKQLCVPNRVTLERFAKAVLDRYRLQAGDIKGALQSIASTGEVSTLLACYQGLMCQRDVGPSDFDKSEEHHRDSLYYALLKNPLLITASAEFEISKVRWIV